MTTQKVGYIRVSSAEQNVERQLESITLDKVFLERRSGKNLRDRVILEECLDYLREGDVLYVHSIDRLARNLLDLQQIIQRVLDKKASIEFVSERLVFTQQEDPFAELTLHLLGAFAEFERKIIKLRQREGIDAARARGKHVGRPMMSAATRQAILSLHAQGLPKAQIAHQAKVSRQTVYRVIQAAMEETESHVR